MPQAAIACRTSAAPGRKAAPPRKFYRPRDHETSPFFKIVRDRFDDFERVLSSITAELVLVDTAGRNCADTDETWPLVDCLPKVARHELNVLVVLPAFLRAKDAEQVIRTYADVRPSAAVITKLDETQESGACGIHRRRFPGRTQNLQSERRKRKQQQKSRLKLVFCLF